MGSPNATIEIPWDQASSFLWVAVGQKPHSQSISVGTMKGKTDILSSKLQS